MQSNEDRIRMVVDLLNNLVKDPALPRNLKEACKETIDKLQDKKITSYSVKSASSISRLEEVAQDPTLPVYARTAIWRAISVLEQVKD
ncbi:MAG TPA: UPF0147 family protein [Geobacterales bacterium]|nr:UPF0147 family protein [Geobacterales bacterium]